MPRKSPIHYIAPSAISLLPNANGLASDIAVYISRETKIKAYSPKAGIDYRDGAPAEWTLTGRNRRLADATAPYTVYARLSKSTDSAYLLFSKKVLVEGQWKDRYAYVTTDGYATADAVELDRTYYYIRLGDVTLPENNSRSVTIDTGILGTEEFNTEWALNPDALPLRVELGCTVSDEDAGPTPYVYLEQSLLLTATLTEGWTCTDSSRFVHWKITRSSGDAEADADWLELQKVENFASLGSILLNHARGQGDDFGGAVNAIFTVAALGTAEEGGSTEEEDLVVLAATSINIMAETVEKYEVALMTDIVSYNPQTGAYSPQNGVPLYIRATDQKGETFYITRGQLVQAGLTAQYAVVGSDSWQDLTFSGQAADLATTTVPISAFQSQQSVNVRLVNAIPKELARETVAFVRDGEDSKEREWIFLRSATAITFGTQDHPYPANINTGTIPDPEHPGQRIASNDKTKDEWVPDGWEDEQQGTSDEYPYEYGSYRSYTHPSDGSAGQWGAFSTPKIWGHYGKDGTSPYFADIDNEMDSIALTADGKAAAAYDKYIGISLWHGSEQIALTSLSYTINGSASYTDERTVGGITVTPDMSNKRLRVRISANTSIADVNTIIVTIAGTGSGSQSLHFVLGGIRPGADGKTPVLFSIIPSASNIKRDNTGTLTPVSVSCSVQKVSGDSVSSATSGDGTLRYRINGDITSSSDGTAVSIGGHVSPGSSAKYITFAFFVGTQLRDKERIPIVSDGEDGEDGDTYRQKYIFKRSYTTPDTPTGQSPSGWSETIPAQITGAFSVETSGDHEGWRKGECDDGENRVDRLSFVTTRADETIHIHIAASSEQGWDFIFVGTLDETLTTRPDMSRIPDSRKASGTQDKIVDIAVPSAGIHFVDVMWTKDSSDSEYEDCGWYRPEPMPTDRVYASMATFKNDVLQGTWSTPVQWGSEDGADGDDGEDAVSVSVTPSSVILTQDPINTTNLSDLVQTFVFVVKKGDVSQTVNSLSFASEMDGSTYKALFLNNGGANVGAGTINNNILTLKSVNTHTQDGKTVYYDTMYADVTVTYGGNKTISARIYIYVDPIGTWMEKVEGDVKTEVAKDLSYAFDPTGQTVIPLEQMGTYIRSSQESVSRIERNINREHRNYFGFTNGLGFTNFQRVLQSYGVVSTWSGNNASGSITSLKHGDGRIVVSFEAKASVQQDMGFQVMGTGTEEVTKTITTAWQRFSLSFDVTSNTGVFRVRPAATSPARLYLRHLKIEKDAETDFFPSAEDNAYIISDSAITEWSYSGIFKTTSLGPSGKPYYYKGSSWPSSGSYADLITANASVRANRIYTLSFWCWSSNGNHVISSYLHPSITSASIAVKEWYESTDEQSEKAWSDGYTQVRVTKSWKKVYIHFLVESVSGESYPKTVQCIALRVKRETFSGVAYNATGTLRISDIQLVEGYVTSINEELGESYSEIKQTADNIRMQVKNTGVNIDDGSVTVFGGKFKMQDNAGNDTFVLDTDGNLTSKGNASFGGTIRAKNFFNNVCIFMEGGATEAEHERYNAGMFYCFNSPDGYNLEEGEYYTLEEIIATELPSTEWGLYIQFCSYDSNLIFMIPNTNNWSSQDVYKTVNLPNPKDFEGKTVEVTVSGYGQTSRAGIVGCVESLKFLDILQIGRNESWKMIRNGNPADIAAITAGDKLKFQSMRLYDPTEGEDVYYWVMY